MSTQSTVGEQITPTSRIYGDQREISLTKKTRPFEVFIRGVLLFCGLVSIITTLGIVYVLAEEALLFVDSRAWVLATTTALDDEIPDAFLSESLSADATRIVPTGYEGSFPPFAPNQIIQIGDEQVIVTERTSTYINVTRGFDDTDPIAHEPDTPMLDVDELQVRTQTPLSETDTIIDLPVGWSSEFEVGQLIRIGSERTGEEIVEVSAVNPESLEVIRATDGTVRAHDDGVPLNFERPVTLVEFFTGTDWAPDSGRFGIWPLLLSTLIVSFIAMLVSIPIGLSAAIFLSEYASDNVRSVLKPILEILAGIPTVVYGFFALTFVTPLLQSVFGGDVGFYNMLSAGLVVGVLIIPLVSSLSEDALRAVPRALREASAGLGATKLETTIRVVLPAGVSGITAALVIAVSRAIGETMIVAIAAGAGPKFTFNVFEGAETMTGHIARISGGDLSYNSIDYNSIFAIGALLFVLTLTLSILSNWISARLREEY